MELTTRPQSGFNWPDTDEKKKSNEFDWPEVDPTTPEPELQTFTYQDRLNAAKEGRTIGANTEPESVDDLRLEFITGFERREGDALMKGETMQNLSRDEVLNYIEAKEAQGFDYGRMMGGIAPAMGTVLDELTRGVFVRGSLDFASGASAPLIEGFHKNLGKESPMNRELRMALGNIQRGNPDRTSMRLAMRMPQGQGVTGGTLEERAQEYLTKAHVTNGQLMASLLGKKVKDLGYDKLPQWMTGGERGEQEITEEMFGPIAESVGRAAWSEFVDSVPESDRKHLKKLGYDSIFDGFDRPKTISTTAQAKVAASTLVNFPARILASMGEGVAQAGHGTAMIGHMAVANWDGGLAKLDQSVNNYLANEALRYRKANNLPVPKKGDELLTGLPEDVVAGWKDKIKPLIEKRRDRIVESWMTKHQYMAEMERARLGKEPILSQAFRHAGNEGAAEALDNLVNKDLALGLAYAGDAPATLAVGAVRQGLTKGAVRSVAGRGVASKAAEGTGKVLKGVDEKIIAPFERAPQAIIDYTESAIGVPLPRKVVNAVDLASIPLLVARTPGAAGEVLEAVGRATSSGQTLQGTAAKIFNDPNAAPWLRNVAGKLQFADPFFEYGYNVMSGAAKGGVAGGAITLATGDEDMIAGGIGSGLGAGLVFAVPASMGGVQRQIKAKNTIDEWLGLKEQEAATAEKAGLTEQAQVLKDNVYILKNLPLETQLRAAELELIVKGFGGNTGKGDIPVEYIFAEKEDFAGYYDRDSQKVIVNLAKAQINDGASLAHEVMHALEHVDNDAMRTTLANINSVMFGDGGIYSMDVQRDRGNQYLARFWEGVDAQRNELLKMDPKDPDYAAAYEQYQLAKASVNKKLGDMDLAPDTREVTAEGFDANAKFQSIVQSEIRAEDFSSMYRSQDPGALLEGPSLVANVKRQIILAKSYSTLGRLRHALEQFFKAEDPEWQTPLFGEDGAPSPLFKNEKGEWATSSPMVNQLLKDYVTLRKNIGEQAEILAKAENNEVMVPTSEEMARNPLLMEMFKGDDHVVKDPTTGEPKLTPDGRPVILSSTQVRKLQRERIKAIDEALQLVDSSGGLQRQADERTGKVRWGGGEEGWTAPMMNDAQVEAIMALPDNVIPANKKEQIKIFHEAMKAGKTVEVFYRGITGATAKRAGWRQDSPFGVEITLDGNVNFRTINLNRLQDNIDRWTNKRNRKTKLDLWDENVSDFLADFATYRENHRNGRPGQFGLHPDEAIALARKERLNELVGVSGSEKARSVSIEGPRRRGAESTRSWQGILKIQPADSDFTLSYSKLRQNFMPAGADKGGAKKVEGVDRPHSPTARKMLQEFRQGKKLDREKLEKAIEEEYPIREVPIPKMKDLPTEAEMFNALNARQRENIGRLDEIPAGTPMTLRQDVDSMSKYGVGIVTGKSKDVTTYENLIRITDPELVPTEGMQRASLKIGSGEQKKPTIVIKGKKHKSQILPRWINTEASTQAGFNPDRHSYIYDRSAPHRPIIGGDEVVQIGNTVFVKNAKFGDKGDFLYMPAGKGGDIFYSNTSKALESPRVRNSATGQAMLNDILRQDPAAVQEMKWIGLLQWLKDKKGKVTKEELQDYIDTNQIAVVEKIRGGDESPEIRAAEEAVEDAKRNMWDADDRGTYQEAREAEAAYMEAVNELDFLKKDLNILELEDNVRALPGAKEGSYRELELMFPKRKGEQFTESHFETDENVFAHVRFNERIDADGKRMLFIEELQSDWWHKGRQLGFEKPYINGDIVGGREESIPAAPFVSKQKGDQFVNDDKWRALAFKRMLRWGADNGYDRVGWITGRDSAARYKLNTYVSKIEYMRLPGENQTMISAWDKAGSNVMSAKMIPNKDLVQTVGKDLAQKIDSDKSGMGEFDGLDLAMGGKFHKVFYDIDLPNYVNKYIKTNWGGEVGMVEVSDTKAHYVDITPQMKADVQQGQAMFMPAGSDAAYMRAAKRGDTKGAQLLVDQAAKAAGYGTRAFHGTASEFTKFNADKIGTTFDIDDDGFYFASNEDLASQYADAAVKLTGRDFSDARVVSAYLRITNPWEIEVDDTKSPIAHFESGDGVFNRGQQNTVRYAIESGYDALVVRNKDDALHVVFDPNQIKSADPITYDDAGNIIPLSERFQPSSDDIRFMPAGEGRAPRRMGSATSRPARTRIPMGAVAKQLRMERDLKELKRN